MTSFKQTRLLSCIVFLYERSMYPFHSSVARRQRLTEGVSDVCKQLKKTVIQNAAARYIFNEPKRMHVTPLFINFALDTNSCSHKIQGTWDLCAL